MLAFGALAVAACGSTSKGATAPRPPAPVNLAVYIDDSRVSVSPAIVSAGPVAFVITNQASQAQSLAVLASGRAAGQPLANTGPIGPRATAQVTVDFSSPGRYSLAAAGGGGAIRAAWIVVGKPRASSDNLLMQP